MSRGPYCLHSTPHSLQIRAPDEKIDSAYSLITIRDALKRLVITATSLHCE